MTPLLPIEALTADAFAPFGEVIECRDRAFFMINAGSTRRYHRLADVDTGPADGWPIISLFRASALDYPLRIALLERHPHGSQAFMPLRGQRFLVVVAPPADSPDPRRLRAFLSDGYQGINYARGVWHHALLALNDGDDFLVVDRAGQLPNCDEHRLPEDQVRWLPAPVLEP